MKHIVTLLFSLLAFQAVAQVDRIELGWQTTRRGIVWHRDTLPRHKPQWRFSRDTNAVLWVDTTTAIRYDWDYKNDRWRAKGTYKNDLPPMPQYYHTLDSVVFDYTTLFWIRDTFNILHKYDSTCQAWTPIGDWIYADTVPSNITATDSNGAAIYTRSLWQDSGDNVVHYWDGDSWEQFDDGIYGDGTPGSGSDTLPPGGSNVTIPGPWQPLSFTINNYASSFFTALLVEADYCSDDAFIKYLVGKTPQDSLEIYNFDCGAIIKETGGQMTLETDQQMFINADSITVTGIGNTTSVPYILAQNGAGTLKRYTGTTPGQILKWNGSNWELGQDIVGSAGSGQNNIGANLGNGAQVYQGKIDTTLRFRTIVDGYGIDYAQTDTTIRILADTAQLATVNDVNVVQANLNTHISADGDLSATNEIQRLDTFAISGNTLRASLLNDGVPFSSVDLSPYVNVATNLTYTGTTSPVTLNSSDGTDVTTTAGTGISLSANSTNMTITNTAPDQTVSITNGGGITVGGTYPAFTLTAADQSATNEIQTLSIDSAIVAGNERFAVSISGGNTVRFDVPQGIFLTDGDKGDVDVTASGATWTVDTAAITLVKMGANSVDSTKVAALALSVTDIGQHGATSGQVLKWNGSQWAPGQDSVGGGGGGINAAANGLYLDGSTVKLGVSPFVENTALFQNGFNMQLNGGKFSHSSNGTNLFAPTQDFGITGPESNPTNSTPTKDAIVEIRAQSGASLQQNSLSIGGFVNDTVGMWMQSRSALGFNTFYPLIAQPRGGKFAVGRNNAPQGHVTLSAVGLTGNTASGRVLMLENSEGSGVVGQGFGTGADNLGAEITWQSSVSAFRITNRNTTAGTSSVRVALGLTDEDAVVFLKSAATTRVRASFGQPTTASIHSTVQSAGSLATAFTQTTGALTLNETHHTCVYTLNGTTSWTLPDPSTCAGRQYVIHHFGSTGQIGLNFSVVSSTGTTFNSVPARNWAWIISDGANWRGYRVNSL